MHSRNPSLPFAQCRLLRDKQRVLMMPPLVTGSLRKVYLACLWEKADTVALWGMEDPKVGCGA